MWVWIRHPFISVVTHIDIFIAIQLQQDMDELPVDAINLRMLQKVFLNLEVLSSGSMSITQYGLSKNSSIVIIIYLCCLWYVAPTCCITRASEVMLNAVLEDVSLSFTARLCILLGTQNDGL